MLITGPVLIKFTREMNRRKDYEFQKHNHHNKKARRRMCPLDTKLYSIPKMFREYELGGKKGAVKFENKF